MRQRIRRAMKFSLPYSSRRATIGSTREARNAGARHAASETEARTAATTVKVTKSRGGISKSRLESSRLSA